MNDRLSSLLASLVGHLDDPVLAEAGVIPWSCPVPVFGDPSKSRVATLGINPSGREFVDTNGRELDGTLRRFHTLRSLGLHRWADADNSHLRSMAEYCLGYFHRYPYDTWFKKLDYIVAGAGATYYGLASSACHVDLVPYATEPRWTGLKPKQRALLLHLAGATFATLLRDSPIEVVVLNGRSVIEEFERVAGLRLDTFEMPAWTLPRRSRAGVGGSARLGLADAIGAISLRRPVLILGFNHNLQSSFGVTREVVASIREWITKAITTTRSARANAAG
jgi:hypothetical protein